MRNFRKNQRGIIAPLAVGIPLILVTVMCWVVIAYPVQTIWDSLNPMMPTSTHGTMSMLNVVMGLTLVIEVVGILVWMGVNSYRKEIVDVPI